MKENINEELNYMKYLLGYKKGVVISEQETTPVAPTQQSGDGCIPITISGKFNVKKADSTEYLTNIIAELDKQIKGKPEFQGGTVTSMRIIGGASNVDNGVKTDFTLNNDYTPSGIKPKQTKEFQNNMGYAQARINAAKQPILDELQKAGLTVGVEPTTEAHVIDTGGVSDGNRNTKTHANAGQVVIVQMTVCPIAKQKTGEEIPELPYLKPTLIPTMPKDVPIELAPLWECFNGIEIDINYDKNKGHNCSSAVWDISANDIPLYRNSKNGEKVNYASLNNYESPNFSDKYDDAVANGKFRYNKFVIDEITAKEFINLNSLQKYKGELEIFMQCQAGKSGKYGLPGHNSSGGGCHKDTANITIKTKEGPIEEEIAPPIGSGEIEAVYKIPACSGIYKRLVSQGVFDKSVELKNKEVDKLDPTGAMRQMVNYSQIPKDVRGNIQKMGQALQK